jgi:hypothetical protein
MTPQSSPQLRSEIHAVRLVWLAAFVSLFSFLFYQRHSDILLYGDAVAHINIARRVFDSRTPGLLQLGTVWLPLPHLLILPFIIPMKLWQTGTGGSIPSMAGYILSVLGIFRLVRTALSKADETEGDRVADISAWASAAVYAANPNLIYMQATAMGESQYLAWFIWAVAFLAEFVQSSEAKGKNRSLVRCGFCLFGACLTRYDGWFLAAVIIVALVASSFLPDKTGKPAVGIVLSRAAVAKFVLLAATGPTLWFAYNAIVYRNALEFANGPYSPRAIEQKTATVNPARNNIWAGTSYFLKAGELEVGEVNWLGRLWLVLALGGSIVTLFFGRGRIALLLWTPLLFYALSIAYGSIPIFVPTWWPLSIYNARYGLQLLPVFAVFVPVAIGFIVKSAMLFPQINPSFRQWSEGIGFAVIVVFAACSYGAIWRSDPICYREASVNSRGRVAMEAQLGLWLNSFPHTSTFLMDLGQHSGVLEEAGIPLRRTINEGNHRVWKQPLDSQGLWERALADPAAYADYAIGFEGDPVWEAARAHHLTALVEIHTTNEAPAAIFPTHPPAPAR